MKRTPFFSIVFYVHFIGGMNMVPVDFSPTPWTLAQVDEKLRDLTQTGRVDAGLQTIRQAMRKALEVSVLSDHQRHNEYEDQIIAAGRAMRKAIIDIRSVIRQKDLITDSQKQASVLIDQIFGDIFCAESMDYSNILSRLGVCVFYWLGQAHVPRQGSTSEARILHAFKKQVGKLSKNFINLKNTLSYSYLHVQNRYGKAIASINKVFYGRKRYSRARHYMILRAALSSAKYNALAKLLCAKTSV